MQHAPSRARSRRWIARGGLASVAALIAFGIQPAVPALAGTWSSPVQLPGSCGSSVAMNQAGAMAAGGTFTADLKIVPG
jgi:UDP-N-acetylenolpyruvoylglucosamine reductase